MSGSGSSSAERTGLVLATLVAAASGAVYFAVMLSMLVDDATWWDYAATCGLGALAVGLLIGCKLRAASDGGGDWTWTMLAWGVAGWAVGVLAPALCWWLLVGAVEWQLYAFTGIFGGVLGAGFALLLYGMLVLALVRAGRWSGADRELEPDSGGGG